MAVIESLQRQIEENLDNVKDVSDDEADGSEENPTEAGENDCENAAPINFLSHHELGKIFSSTHIKG